MGLLSAAMLAELQKTNPQVYPVFAVAFPSLTKLWSSSPVNIRGLGFYDGRVTSWGGPFVRSVSDRDGNLPTPSMTITVDDSDRVLGNIFEGGDAHKLRGSVATVKLVSPNVTSSDWATILTGVVAGWKTNGVTAWDVTCQYNDLPLKSFVPKTAFMASDWPAALPAIYGTYVPIIYGPHNSSGLGVPGMVPLYLVAMSTSTPEYAASLGWLSAVSAVYIDGIVASTTQYSVSHPVKNGRQYTTAAFLNVVTTVSSSGGILTTSPSSSSTVTADVMGYESVGNGTGSVLYGPAAIQHFLENFVFGDYQSGLWATVGTYTDATNFTTAQAWAVAIGTQYTSRWIGGAQQNRAMDEVAAFLRSVQCHAFWTWGGKFAVLPFDLRDATVSYSAPQWAFEPKGDTLTPPDVSYDYASVMDRISLQYLYGQANGKYFGQLEIRDQALSEQAPDSLQMGWSPAALQVAGNFNSPTPSREAASYRLNRFRHPLMEISDDLPLWAVDRELLDGFSWSHRLGPSSVLMGPGWGKKVWQRRSSRIFGIGVDLDRRSVAVSAWDRRFIDCTLWDTMLTTRSVNSEAQGIPRILSGANRAFQRSTKCWIPDPSDGTIREIAINIEAITADGYLAEISATNVVTRSAFVSGLTGWTVVTGSAATDTASTLWDTTLTPGGVKMASTSGGVNAEITHVTAVVGTTMVGAGGGGRFSMSYLNDTTSAGVGFYYDIQRSSDLKWFTDATGAWTSAGALGVTNGIPFSIGTKSRFVSTSKIVPASSSETFTLHVYLNTTLTGHVYDAQIEDRPFATSRILTDGASVTRTDGALLYQDFTALRQSLIDPRHGTMGIEFVADWDRGDAAGAYFAAFPFAFVHRLGDGQTSGTDYDFWKLEWTGGSFQFRAHVAGLDYVAILASSSAPVRGTRYRLVGRWTASSSGQTDATGDLGLPYRTLSVLLSTTSGSVFTKGTDAVRAADPASSPYGWLSVGAPITSSPSTASLSLWLKADTGVYRDAGVTLAVDGDTVQQWNDQSGSARNFTQASSSGPRPTFKTGIVNSKPVVRFNGATWLTSSTSAPVNLSTLLGTSGTGHMFVVFNPASYVAGDPLFLDGSTVAGLVLTTTSGGGTVTGTFAFNTAGGVTVNQQKATPAATWACVEWIHSGSTTLYSTLSGTSSAGTSSAATDATSTVLLGKRNSPAFLTGDIPEVLVFSAEQTGAALMQTQEYIQRKYAISFSNNPRPAISSFDASCALSRLRITPHVLADDELARLFT